MRSNPSTSSGLKGRRSAGKASLVKMLGVNSATFQLEEKNAFLNRITRMLVRCFGILTILQIGGCAVVGSGPEYLDKYQFKDVPDERKIALRYTNTTRTNRCISDSNWPDPNGAINSANSDIALIVGYGRMEFPVKDRHLGHCIPACTFVVKPGETIVGVIPYTEFSLPDRFIGARKTFQMELHSYRC